MSEKTKTAKTPEKPSGKASVIGSAKPYREPKVLGPKTKVKSVGPILGGNPKKNPTLSTKFFGTCSANNDPGDKLILGEASGELAKLKALGPHRGAALILPNNKVYVGKTHWRLRDELYSIGIDPSLETGTVRIRYAGTEGFDRTNIEFMNKEPSTIARVFSALDNIETPQDIFKVEFTATPWKQFCGSPQDIKPKIENWSGFDQEESEPRYSSDMNYWRGHESRINKKKALKEYDSSHLAKLGKLADLRRDENWGAALVLANGAVYVGPLHYYLAMQAKENGDDASLDAGTIRVRYAGTAGFDTTTIEFKTLNQQTIDRIMKIIDFLSRKTNVFDVECTGARTRGMHGTKDEIKVMLDRLLKGYERDQAQAKPQYSSAMNFWRESIQEAINYKSFKNATKAVSKTCPACDLSFKNISDPNQIFCSQQCEEDGGLALKLHEAFKRF